MLNFDPSDPFPETLNSGADYSAEKDHAARVDQWLGIRAPEIEARLAEVEHQRLRTLGPSMDLGREREFWIGKSVQTFSTPYTELRAMLNHVDPQAGTKIIDLGAGYGRMAHVLARHFADVFFVGYEWVQARQIEGQAAIERQHLKCAELVCADVTELDFVKDAVADIYFMYDFGSREDVEITVENLKKAAAVRPVVVIARGGRSRDVIEKRHPWLSQVVSPLHRPHYSIYRSANDSSELG